MGVTEGQSAQSRGGGPLSALLYPLGYHPPQQPIHACPLPHALFPEVLILVDGHFRAYRAQIVCVPAGLSISFHLVFPPFACLDVPDTTPIVGGPGRFCTGHLPSLSRILP